MPNHYFPQPQKSNSQHNNEFAELVEKFDYDSVIKNDDSITKYLKNFRKIFQNNLQSAYVKGSNILPSSIIQFVQVLLKFDATNLIGTKEFKNFQEFTSKSSSLIKTIELSNLQKLGIVKAVTYGLQINQLKKNTKDEAIINLTEIHKFTQLLLNSANRNSKRSPSKSPNNLSK